MIFFDLVCFTVLFILFLFYLHFQRVFFYFGHSWQNIIVSVSRYNIWAFPAFGLFSFFSLTAWLWPVTSSFLLQVVFLPPCSLIFPFFLLYLPEWPLLPPWLRSTSVSFCIQLNISVMTSSLKAQLSNLDLGVFSPCMLEERCEAMVKMVDIWQEKTRHRAGSDMALGNFCHCFTRIWWFHWKPEQVR